MDNNIQDNSNNQALNPDINLNQTFPGLWNYQPNWDEFHMAREQVRPQMRFNIFSLPASSQAQMLGQSEIQMPLEQLPIFYQNQILNQPQQIFMSHLIQQQQQQQQQQYQQSQIQHDQQQQQHQQHQQQLIQQQQQINILSQRQQNVVSLSSQSNQSDNPLNQPIDLSFQNYENFVQNNQNGFFGFSPQYQQNPNANQPSYQFILNLPQPQNQQFNQDQFMHPNNPNRYFQRQSNNVNDRASSQQPIQNDKYYKLNENQVEVSSYDPEEPFMKITVMKSSTGQQSIANNSEFIVTSKGLVKSQKNTTQEDIIIGRCLSQDQLQGPKIIPNDIVLTTSDRAISRVHCKIISKHAFDGTNQITEEFIQFLRLFSRGSKSEYQYLPNHILRSIWEFVKQQKLFYLQDIGSVYGTYVRLYNNQSQQVQKGQIYFIGADNTFNVLECQTENDQNLLEKSESSKDLIANLLAQDFSKLNVHGLTREEYLSIESASELIRCQKQQGNDTFTLDSQPFSRPYLRIEFKVTNLNTHPNQTLPDGDDSFQQHLFFGPSLESNIGDMQIENPQAIFRIGRGGDDNHVRIHHNTISRKQCRFWYCVKSKKWFISDGDQVRESSNGTWISLQNCLDKKQQNDPRLESTQWPLQNGTEIKISESILKVEMFNFNKKQGRTKNNELSQKLLSIVQ